MLKTPTFYFENERLFFIWAQLTDSNVGSMAIHFQVVVHDERRLYQTTAMIV